MRHRNITNKCLVLPQELRGVVSRKDRKSLCSMIHPMLCSIFPVARPEWTLKGMFTPLPTTFPSAKCGTLVFWNSFKGRKKVTRGQELGNANFVTKVAVLAGISCVEGLVQPGVFQPKCSCQRHTQLETVFAIGSIYSNSSVCVRCELRGWNIVHYQKLLKVVQGVRSPCFLPHYVGALGLKLAAVAVQVSCLRLQGWVYTSGSNGQVSREGPLIPISCSVEDGNTHRTSQGQGLVSLGNPCCWHSGSARRWQLSSTAVLAALCSSEEPRTERFQGLS